jgi:hypothetical protein
MQTRMQLEIKLGPMKLKAAGPLKEVIEQADRFYAVVASTIMGGCDCDECAADNPERMH